MLVADGVAVVAAVAVVVVVVVVQIHNSLPNYFVAYLILHEISLPFFFLLYVFRFDAYCFCRNSQMLSSALSRLISAAGGAAAPLMIILMATIDGCRCERGPFT